MGNVLGVNNGQLDQVEQSKTYQVEDKTGTSNLG